MANEKEIQSALYWRSKIRHHGRWSRKAGESSSVVNGDIIKTDMQMS